MSNKKLAECLLRRKELQGKIDRIKPIKDADIYEVRVKRINITDSLDDVTANVPKLTLSQVLAENDFYAKQLRLIDASIQQQNWTTDVSLAEDCFSDFKQ